MNNYGVIPTGELAELCAEKDRELIRLRADLREIECECPNCHAPLIIIDGKCHTQDSVDNGEEDD